MKILNLDPSFTPFQTFMSGIENKQFNFPSRCEPHIKLPEDIHDDHVKITCRIKSANDLLILMLAVDALRRADVKRISLFMPYLPFARQDRVMVKGEPLSVKVIADLITLNNKGFKVLNPKVGLIYGDGMYLGRYQTTLDRLHDMGYAASNLVIGVGGILRNHSRDTLGFAIKATYVEVSGEHREIEKDPVTDNKKKSHKGLLSLTYGDNMEFITIDQCTADQEQKGLLKTVFRNGELLIETTFAEIKEQLRK